VSKGILGGTTACSLLWVTLRDSQIHHLGKRSELKTKEDKQIQDKIDGAAKYNLHRQKKETEQRRQMNLTLAEGGEV